MSNGLTVADSGGTARQMEGVIYAGTNYATAFVLNDPTTQNNKAAVGSDGSLSVRFGTVAPAALADALANPTTVGLQALLGVFNGATWDRQRTPNVFKTVSATVITSETTVWTPTSGKKFRLMGAVLTQGVATGAITLKDGTGLSTILIIPAHTIAVAFATSLGGNGILSGAADRVLTATGASTETITGFFYGTEE